MNSNEFYNASVVEWARRNLQNRVEIKVLFSSKAGMIFTYLLVFFLPLAFVVTGVVTTLIGVRDPLTSLRLFSCGIVLLIPSGIIALLGKITRANFPKSLDANGVNTSMGRKLYWGKLFYVDHVSKHYKSTVTKDNQLELIFENGKVVIPPMIHERGKVWDLINSMPAQVKDDGVPRVNRSVAGAGNAIENPDDLMRVIQLLPKRENPL